MSLPGQRFKRIPHASSVHSTALDPALNGNLDQWPHLRILVQCYKTDWLKDEGKYGCYGSIQRSSFQSQIFEGPDTDVETEIHLANLHQARNDDCPDDEEPTTSGRQSNKKDLAGLHCRWLPKHLGPSPLHAYEPAFNWESERATIFGQRMQELHASTYQSGLKVAVKVISLKLQAGFVEPIYGTLSLYHRERREKLSEDFSFQFLPGENSEEMLVLHRRAIFSLDSISPSVYMLIQLEKHATEEGGIKSSVYSRKEPVHLTEKEKQRLQVWARIMPFREPFAWAVVPLFEMNIGNGIPGISSPSSPRGAGSTDILDADGRSLSGNRHVQDCFNSPVIIEIPGLNRVKDCYNEDWLQDPKKKIHKPVKATLRLEVERISTEEIEVENSSNASSPSNPSDHVNYDGISAENSSGTSSRLNNGHAKRGNGDQMHLPKTVVSGSEQQGISEGNISDFRALDFRLFTRNEPFTQLVHCLYVYPQSVSLSRKRNLFIRVQFKDDDINIHKQGLEAIYAKDPSVGLQSYVHSQIAVSARTSYFHDEFKIRLPAVSTTQHHILFTFFHVDLHMKLEAPKPTIIGYAFLPISLGSQALRLSDGSLPIVKELLPHYLQDNMKDKLEYVEDGRTIFKLRLRLCSSIYPMNERVHDFFDEFDRHSLRTSPPWGSELLEAINSLKNVDSTSMTQFLYPFLNMLLYLIGDSGETLQVAAFRAMVAILTRVQQESYRAQQESSDSAERNAYLVQYVDYVFDDFNGEQAPVYPGLCNVWRGLARSKAKGYRVGPVYDDVLSMAWVFLELIVKSAALEQARAFSDNLPLGEDVPPLQLTDDVFRCILNLYDCLLTEVHERCKKGLSLARRLNSSLAFFCYDLLSVIDPRQVFELVALYFDKFTGVCQSTLHDCKLTFLQIVCDHDLFIEMPGRDPSERNYLASVLMQEVFLTWDHDDLAQRARAARILVILMCKHEFDIRYQKIEDKLYISQLYFQLIGLILDEIPVFYNLSPTEKREVLVCVLQIVRHLDDVSLIKAWQQSVARTRLFFKLMEECLVLFEHKKTLDSPLISGAARSPDGEAAYSPKYSDKLSPAVNLFLADASRQELKWMQPQATPDNGHIWKKLSPQLTSPNQPYSLREALAQAQSSRKGASNRALRESLHPLLRQKLEVWEENLSAAVSLQVLEIAEKFTHVAAVHSIATDYVKLDCVTAIFTGFLSRSQPLTFWNAFVPVFNNLFSRHGATLMGRENDRFLKQIAFHLLQLAVFRNESIRRKAVVSLQILVRCSFYHFHGTARLCVMLTITLSELMSEVQVTQMRSDGNLEESGEACRLRKSLEEMASEECSRDLLRECALDEGCLNSQSGEMLGSSWQWSEVHKLSSTLLRALDASVEHALLSPTMVLDKYAAAESYHSLAWAYAHVPDLHIMWLLHLCDAHQEMQSWAEAAQCAVAVAGVIMQALVVRKDAIWAKEHVDALRKICPMLTAANAEASAAEVEGYGASKLTVDSAVKYLQLANKLFAQAELFHFCAAILELIIPVHKNRRAYGQLAKCHTSLTSIYDSILEQESNPLPFIDATYYRVGFYGKRFGKLNRKEYVYREARDIRLGDIMEKLGHIYESKVNGDHTLHIIPDSRQVNADELQSGVCYLQITSVDPVLDEEELESRRERVAGQIPNYSCARVFNQFLYDTPFTKNGKTQGGLEDQWKRRTALQTEGSFPALVSRLLVVKSESREFSPIENAIGMIETRTVALRNELEEPRSSDGDHLPRLQSLQRILQGSVAVQVNSGVLGVCTAFLSGEPATKLKSQELQQLIAALLEFMAVCKRAIRVHSRLIGEEDQDFHSQLVNGFQSLTAELSHYIPAILSEL